MSGKWNATCQTCGLIVSAQAQRCPRCGAPVSLRDWHSTLPGASRADPLHAIPGSSGNATLLSSEPPAERPFNVVLSLAPEFEDEQSALPVDEAPPSFSYPEAPPAALIDAPAEDTPFPDASARERPSLPNALLLPLAATAEDEPLLVDDQRAIGSEGKGLSGARSDYRALERVSPRLIWVSALALALIFGLLFFFARSVSPAGSIAPDWGLASLRIGLAAAVFSIPASILWFLLWRVHAQTPLAHAGVFALVLIVIGAAGLLSAAPLHRLQGQWFEARGQYGLALGAYQLSGDTVATNQTMARIAVEWAEALNTTHHYGDAVAQLQPVMTSPVIDETLAMRARKDMIAAYLAWGDQAQQQQTFGVAAARYQTLGRAAYCDAPCEAQVHAASAQALLGLAQQLTAGQQYDQAVTTYEQLVNGYSDTPEGEQARTALSAPQPLKGRLIYPDMSPAANFHVVLASQWSFDSSTQVLKLEGQQYQAQTDVTGAFSLPSVAVGNTYMIAWVDTNGHSGTCITTNNQPLYTVRTAPLRATDAGSIDIECT